MSDAQKFYSSFRSLSLGKVLLEDLGLGEMVSSMLEAYNVDPESLRAVSYTHLTLPTIA
jgi:hypothetical protein